jgi:hypothetical protein
MGRGRRHATVRSYVSTYDYKLAKAWVAFGQAQKMFQRNIALHGLTQALANASSLRRSAACITELV